MPAQDILLDLRARRTARRRRLALLVAASLLLFALLLRRCHPPAEPGLDEQLLLGSRARRSLSFAPPPPHLISLVDQRPVSAHTHHAPLGVAAVIVLSKHTDLSAGSVQLVVRLLARYPFVKELIVWNDDALETGADIVKQDILDAINSTTNHLSPAIRIFNSPGGMKDLSYHMACSTSRFETCYFNDPNVLNFNLNTLYAKYVESNCQSMLAIANHALPADYLAELPYEIQQAAHHLQIGIISQLSRGSFVPKQLSIRYFHQLSTASLPSPTPYIDGSDAFRSLASDIQFTAWSNRPPLKLISTPESLVAISNDVHETYLDPEFIKFSYQRLNATIQASDPFVVPETFPRSLKGPDASLRHEVGVVSARDDRSMLITNTEYSKDWSLAVDGSFKTCWKGASRESGFVGLNFVTEHDIHRLSVIGEFPAKDWALQVLTTKVGSWISTYSVPMVISDSISSKKRYVFDLSDRHQTSIKKIRLKAVNNEMVGSSITICGWEVNEDWNI